MAEDRVLSLKPTKGFRLVLMQGRYTSTGLTRGRIKDGQDSTGGEWGKRQQRKNNVSK